MLRSQLQVTDQDARSISAVKGQEYHGQVAHTLDGRTYVYATAGASNLSPGKLTIAPATTANHVNQTGVAYAIGTTSLTYTVGATDAAANLYASGYFSVNDGTGPCVYRIKSNTLSNATNSRSITVVLESDEGLTVATTTSSKFSLYNSPFNFTIVAPGDASAYQATGVPNVAVTATYSYWSQTSGYAAVLNDSTAVTKGAGAILSAATAGAATIDVSSDVLQHIGYAPELTVSAKYYPLILTIQQ